MKCIIFCFALSSLLIHAFSGKIVLHHPKEFAYRINFRDDDDSLPVPRVTRETDTVPNPQSEVYSLKFPFLELTSPSNAEQRIKRRHDIVFPTAEPPSTLPERSARPIVNPDGVLTFSKTEPNPGMAASVTPATSDLVLKTRPGKLTGTQLGLLAEQQLIEERVVAFTDWIKENGLYPKPGTGAVIVPAIGGEHGEYALVTGAELRCPEGKTFRNGNCEDQIDFEDI